MRLPKITLITPSFNQGRFLEATIKSVLDQNYPNLEYMVMDGGSTDDSPAIIHQYADRLAYWEIGPDDGQTHAINKGLARATGDLVNWLNSDDLLLPGALFRLARAWQRRPKAQVFYGDYQAVDANGELIYKRMAAPYSRHALVWGRQLSSQPSVFFSVDLSRRLGHLDQALTFCMDTEFWIRAALAGAEFAQIQHPIGATRVHGDAKTTLLQHVLKAEHQAVLARNGLLKGPRNRAAEVHFFIKNRLWRGRAALARAFVRKDFSFMAASRALNRLT